VLSNQFNIDEMATDKGKGLRSYLGVERLHANELGFDRLVKKYKFTNVY
jgi:hypothetical protein